MNYCLYESVHSDMPTCSNNCKECGYYYHDSFGDIIKEWRIEANVKTPILYKYDSSKQILTLCTSRPGYMIGYHGQLIYKYREKLNKLYATRPIKGIDFIEVEDELC